MEIRVSLKSVKDFNAEKFETNFLTDFPKYTTQLINLASGTAQATRPKVVGQMSELFPESNATSINEWREWYLSRCPKSIDEATDKIYSQILKLKSAIALIDKELVRKWVEDLVINKTFNGLYMQDVILHTISKKYGDGSYRRSTPEDEAKGIDGYIGEKAYSIKPDTYKSKSLLNEQIDVTMVYYTKTENELIIEIRE